jgi:hypothetical protein
MRLTRTLLLASLLSLMASATIAQSGMKMDSMTPQQLPKEVGQGAFAAIHEIVGMLEGNPKTDWSKVNIDALRQHLIDMDNVTLHARITYEPIANGEHIHVSGDGGVRDSIQRMVTMHVAMAGDTPDWHMQAMNAPDGVHLNVTAKTAIGLQKMKALGLIGMMAEGVHHERHHMMLATGVM